MKNMGKERDLQEGLHICKFATLQKKKKMWLSVFVEGKGWWTAAHKRHRVG